MGNYELEQMRDYQDSDPRVEFLSAFPVSPSLRWFIYVLSKRENELCDMCATLSSLHALDVSFEASRSELVFGF